MPVSGCFSESESFLLQRTRLRCIGGCCHARHDRGVSVFRANTKHTSDCFTVFLLDRPLTLVLPIHLLLPSHRLSLQIKPLIHWSKPAIQGELHIGRSSGARCDGHSDRTRQITAVYRRISYVDLCDAWRSPGGISMCLPTAVCGGEASANYGARWWGCVPAAILLPTWGANGHRRCSPVPNSPSTWCDVASGNDRSASSPVTLHAARGL